VRESWKIGHRPWVLNVSNHAPLKGHRSLFQLAKILPKGSIVVNIGNAYLTEKWGAGRYGVKGGCFYQCWAKALLQPAIQLQQHVPRPTIVSAMREADVMVHPSAMEASPLVILEAMAAGLPWVAFDAGNIREFPGGIVVRNLEEMAASTAKLLANPDLRRRLGEEGRKRVLASHSWEKIVDSYEQLYYQLWRGKLMAKVS
jgi:glycosyltransferase involved in cell wall biosynthesis